MRLIKYLLAALMWISCSKVETYNPGESTIAYGLTGGWCAGFDSLSISPNGSYYYAHKPCAIRTEITIPGSVTLATTMSIYNALNVETFNNMQLNACARCVDGVDYWMSVTTPTSYHKIYFLPSDTANLAPIIPLVHLLNEEIKKYR